MNNNIMSLDDSNHSKVENSSSIRDYSNNDYSQPTQNVNTSNYQESNTIDNNVEEVDLTLDTLTETANIANESTDYNSSIHDTGSSVMKGITSFIVEGIKSIGRNLSETASNVASNTTSLASAISESFNNGYKSVLSTAAVVGSTVVSGALSLGETVTDGFLWCGGKAVRGITSVCGNIVGIFNRKAGKAIKNAGKQVDQSAKEVLSQDIVGEINTWFFEDTMLGKAINENSTIKYDSELADNMRAASEKAAELVAMTCIPTGAAVIATGTLFGIGKGAEATYQQNGTQTTALQELGIIGSGALTGLSWMATGKLINGFIDIGKTAAKDGASQVLSKISKDIVTTKFWKNALKEGVTGMNGVGNVVSSAMMTGEEVTPYITGEKEWTVDGVTKLALTFAFNLGLNIAEDALRGYVTDFSANKTIGAIDKKIEKSDISEDASFGKNTDGQIVYASASTNNLAIKKAVEQLDLKENPIDGPINVFKEQGGESFTELMKKIENLPSEELPSQFSSTVEYQQFLTKKIMDEDLLRGLKANVIAIYDIGRDPNLVGFIKDTDWLPKFTKAYLGTGEVSEVLKNLTKSEVQSLFEGPILNDFITESPKNLACAISNLADVDVDCFGIKKISSYFENMSKEEFLSFIKDSPQNTFKLYENKSNEGAYHQFFNNLLMKYVDKETIINDLELRGLLYTKLSITSDFDNYRGINDVYDDATETIKGMLYSKISSDIGQEVVYNSLPADGQHSIYSLVYKIGGEERVIDIQSNASGCYIGTLVTDTDILKALNRGEFEVVSYLPNEIKASHIISNTGDLSKGIYSITYKNGDAIERTTLKINPGSVKEIKNLPFPNEKVDIMDFKFIGDFDINDGGDLYKVTYNNGVKDVEFLINKYEGDNTVYINNALDDLGGIIDDVRVEQIEKLPAVDLEYSKNPNIFGIKYGGDQADVSRLVTDFLSSKLVDESPDGKKAKVLVDMIKKYYPDATDVDIRNIARAYETQGCSYMTTANAFCDFIEKNNLYDKFYESFGYDIRVPGSDIPYNIEAIALEPFLRKATKMKKHSINDLIEKEDMGISMEDWYDVFSGFFKEKGIEVEWDHETMCRHPETFIYNSRDSYIGLGDEQFSLTSDNKIKIPNGNDGALKTATIEGDTIKVLKGHSMLVTDMDSDGNIFVSSWSRKYKYNRQRENNNIYSFKFRMKE